MGRTRPHPVVLALTVRGRVAPIAFGMHSHAPATAEDSVVALHQLGEGRPGRIVKNADGVVGHSLKLDPRSDTRWRDGSGHASRMTNPLRSSTETAPLANPHACSTVPVDPPAVFTGEGAIK